MKVSSLETIKTKYFCQKVRWQSWLDVEAELAIAQGELGIIPADAAQKIADAAQLSNLDQDALQSEIDQTMAPVYALTKILAKAAGDAGGYVHWGATTQNVVDTGKQLVLRRYQDDLLTAMGRNLKLLSAMAEKYADLRMVGRTNRQNALPITFGFKVAGWIDEMLRVGDQLKEVESRLFQLRFGGAVGGYHSLGADGERLAKELAKRLDLPMSLVPGRTSVDPYIEYVCKLAMVGVACGRIADEMYLLMQEEIGEVREDLGKKVIGSSTMPHKSNPKMVIDLRARANILRSKAGAVLTCSNPSHEADAATNRELLYMLEDTCPLALHVLDLLEKMLGNIVICEDRIQSNYAKTQELMATEALMMQLAGKVGRGKAHDLVHEMVIEANRTGVQFGELMEKENPISTLMSAQDWQDTLNSDEIVGLCPEIARNAAAEGAKWGKAKDEMSVVKLERKAASS